jgi:uracil-DNA glycosylase family 4
VSGASQSPLAALAREIEGCRRCPRLVAWREQVAREPRASFAGQRYAAHPLAGFGDPAARVALLGLAPAAHGGNRTGRIFTGDRSGDFLFAALHRTGFANQPTSTGLHDGLRLHDAWVTAAVRCAPPANRPSTRERDECLPWSRRELELLPQVRVVVCLGGFAWDAALRLRAQLAGEPPPRPRPRFGHAAEDPPGEAGGRAGGTPSGGAPAGALHLLGCFHPSQQNTFTGRLTAPMIDAVLLRARELASQAYSRSSSRR